MLLKRIEAKTLPEAIERVRTECGADALVVETRPTRDGFLVVASKPEPAAPHRDQAGSASFLSKWTRGFRPMADKAADFGLSRPILQAVERALLGTKVELSRPGDPALPNLASRVMAALIHQEPRFESADGFRAVALVGPTGVGKTTTLAKLAARAKERGERVAIITLDTYRMAAVEQLRSFAELLDVPLSVALSTQDVRRVIEEHQSADRIYIDTIGKSPRSRESLPTLLHTLRAADAHSLLCVAAGTRQRDAKVIIDAYDELNVDGVCLTKWDETVAPGEALATVVEQGLPLSHLCIGQEVPSDIVVANSLQIAQAAFDCEPLGGEA